MLINKAGVTPILANSYPSIVPLPTQGVCEIPGERGEAWEIFVIRNCHPRIRGAWATMIAKRRERQRTEWGVDRADGGRRQFDWSAAVDGYRRYLRRYPRDFGIQLRLIRTLYAAGRLEEAEVLLDEAVRARPGKRELKELAVTVRAARSAFTPIADYNLFRRDIVIPQPPVATAQHVAVLIDARAASTALIELTIAALQRSEIPAGPIVVWSGDPKAAASLVSRADLILLLDAGVTLDPRALGWLLHAIGSKGAVAAHGDDDQAVGAGEATVWSSPAFHVAPHPADLATTPRVPAAILVRSAILAGPFLAVDRRVWLTEAFGAGPVAHVPLLLATVWDMREPAPMVVVEARDADSEVISRARILAVIPTRDEGAVLAAMIESLESRAVQLSKLEIVVVDNGSRDPDTLTLLDGMVHAGRIRLLVVDEPFNWSRLNNLAAAGNDAEILLFANNDMVMISDGWDDRLRRSLLQSGVGVVGARLVYPNGLLQHGGMVLGALDGKPVHEGLGASRSEGGPLDRWRRNRPAAAVTGAFMGVRRELFEQVGGFNAEEFAIGCNDIDFCLRARERGWSVLYAADLELMHRESYSRGHDDTEDRMRRAKGELEALSRIWGEDASRDPGRNPHWVNHETMLYSGVRQPELAEVEAWIDRSADLWRVRRRGAQPDWVSPRLR